MVLVSQRHSTQFLGNIMNQFIIWTVQRTGGTNFATNLIKLSGLPITAHEPLNLGRPYGYITKNWQDTHDRLHLDKSLGDFLDNGYAIKHCVENVDWAINESLILRSLERNFFHIILYRENSLDRLLSLHFALETGLWGRKKVSLAKKELGNGFNDGVSVRDLDIDSLVNHEKYCSECLIRISRSIRNQTKRILSISFEDIYEIPYVESTNKVSKILKEIGFSDNDIIIKFLDDIRGLGDQGSKTLYKGIRRREELEYMLNKITPIREILNNELSDIVL